MYSLSTASIPSSLPVVSMQTSGNTSQDSSVTSNSFFTKHVVKFIAAGTLVCSYGSVNAPRTLSYIDPAPKNIENSYEGTVSYSNGSSFTINSSMEDRPISHQTDGDGIDYSVTNEVADIVIWTDTSREAIRLKHQESPIFKNEGIVKSKVINAGFFEPELDEDDFKYTSWDHDVNESDLLQFEKIVKSKVVNGGEFLFPPLD